MKRLLVAAAIFALCTPARADPAIHHGPAENLEHVDVHLKSYEIDGRLLRTGAANFSALGEKRQDDDLVVIESAEAAAAFKHNFEARFASGEALPLTITSHN